jgi:hypothetical protein
LKVLPAVVPKPKKVQAEPALFRSQSQDTRTED